MLRGKLSFRMSRPPEYLPTLAKIDALACDQVLRIPERDSPSRTTLWYHLHTSRAKPKRLSKRKVFRQHTIDGDIVVVRIR